MKIQRLLIALTVVRIGNSNAIVPAPLLPVFTEAPTFSDERREGMTQRQVQTFKQTGAETVAHVPVSGRASAEAKAHGFQKCRADMVGGIHD